MTTTGLPPLSSRATRVARLGRAARDQAEYLQRTFTEPVEWLRKVRPHLRQLLTVLKHAAPLAGPVLGMAVAHVSERLSAELEAMKEIVDQIPEFSRDLGLPGKDGQPDTGPVERAPSEADFRVMKGYCSSLTQTVGGEACPAR